MNLENNPNYKDGLSVVDRTVYSRRYYEKNKDKCRERNNKYKNSPAGKLKDKQARLKRTFGITIEDYEAMLIKQNHCCGICHVHQSEMVKCFDIDHDHVSNKVRGLLCNPCNQALGLLGDSEERIANALSYLKGMNG